MLAVSPLRNTNDENQNEMESFSVGADFPEFSDGNLLDSINFDNLFVGINVGDMLPDLEKDPEIFAEFSVSGGEESELTSSVSTEKVENVGGAKKKKDDEDKATVSSASGSVAKDAKKGRKSSSQSKNSQGKRKVKVDWTPELHRRFVQAVEQLGVDKAVPSRILEIMGIDCLNRHNIASHLQKYRLHRKHLLAREAEAASWSQRRQMYGGGGGSKRDMSSWLAAGSPIIGFPATNPMHHFRPLHAWAPPSPDPSFWQPHYQMGPNPLAPGTPCFPHTLPTMRFASPPVPGMPPPPIVGPNAMYKVDPGIGVPTGQPRPRPLFDFHPSNESIDAALGDVLLKPWLPLALGLKSPALDSVLGELQRQGVSKIPP
ncbi:Two-component response regulator-like APRR2 [Quillaja saponaria]|uniref:Two-component response regulator-like APRR2 n=1 Tax=Quillaja saponaria TaxID=32244 RepID=A0AAD7QHF5_QUISA|nr:Two-component response regulator-like APRR2 [Quillaja saponaria]